MATKTFIPKIVSANDLMIGDVVYLRAGGGWTRSLTEAAIAHDADAAADLMVAADQPGVVVGPYLADVALDGPAPRPLHFREAFRASGPTHRPDLRRQAEEV